MKENYDFDAVEHSITDLLNGIGEDSKREGLLNTPNRVARSYEYLTSGYKANIDKIINNAIFDEKTKDMVIVQDIELYSLCEHHLLPFFGKAHVAYIPNGKVIGLSKIPRIVDVFARRLQIQERLTKQIADAINEAIQPLGVAVVIEAKHLCMMMRGVEKQNSFMKTSSLLGAFKKSYKTRMEFMNLIQR